jgi:hypothetical protein
MTNISKCGSKDRRLDAEDHPRRFLRSHNHCCCSQVRLPSIFPSAEFSLSGDKFRSIQPIARTRIIADFTNNCRLETISDFDRIVVLDQGNLVECDSPKNLLARDSMFKSLYDAYEMKKQE